MSRIGKMPIAVPAGVTVEVAENNKVTVKGPKGTLTRVFPAEISFEQENGQIEVKRPDDQKKTRALHGLSRSLLNNMVKGVTDGFSKTLIITGVGFRADVKGKELVMNLGYSTDFIAMIPDGLTVTATPDGKVTIAGIDKQLVGEFSSQIRKLRKPEPYKGKGIRYEDEVIRRKVGKTGVK